MDKKLPKVKMELDEIDITLIDFQPINPNAMDDGKFSSLVESIQNDGFYQPVGLIKQENGRYRVLAGEHRVKAMSYLKQPVVPSIVYLEEQWEKDKERFLVVRDNVLRGKVDAFKLMQMIDTFSTRYPDEVMKKMFGFTDEAIVRKVFQEIRKELPEELKKKLDEAKNEIKTIDGLSNVVNKLLSEYGSTIDSHFVVFALGGKKHIYIEANNVLYAKIVELSTQATDEKLDINDLFLNLFDRKAKKTDGKN